ncbi:unnamed protein product [Paramecium primaurelia]|uniref:Uncharacterized protein n=1 Tax=Paramecium primaurelia TaxID=5886 RepID=A0A8S1QH75_PARPR|nr:unnamed protein product [Paramecium primaurelia]
MLKQIILLLFITSILTIDCDYCKAELLDSLRVKTDSVIVKCLDSDFSKNPVGTIFGNCLSIQGVDSYKIKQLVSCITSNCWDQWINQKNEQFLF